MPRNRSSDLILDTAPLGTPIAGVVGSIVGRALVIAPDCDDLHLVFRVDASAVSLAGDVTIKMGNGFGGNAPLYIQDDITAANLPALLAAATTAVTVMPTGVALDTVGTPPAAKWIFTTPAVGASTWGVRIMHPPPVIVPVFTFVSGGGNIRLRVKAVY